MSAKNHRHRDHRGDVGGEGGGGGVTKRRARERVGIVVRFACVLILILILILILTLILAYDSARAFRDEILITSRRGSHTTKSSLVSYSARAFH